MRRFTGSCSRWSRCVLNCPPSGLFDRTSCGQVLAVLWLSGLCAAATDGPPRLPAFAFPLMAMMAVARSKLFARCPLSGWSAPCSAGNGPPRFIPLRGPPAEMPVHPRPPAGRLFSPCRSLHPAPLQAAGRAASRRLPRSWGLDTLKPRQVHTGLVPRQPGPGGRPASGAGHSPSVKRLRGARSFRQENIFSSHFLNVRPLKLRRKVVEYGQGRR